MQLQLTVPILDGFRRQNRVAGGEPCALDRSRRSASATSATQVETEARQAVLDLASAQQQVAIAGDRLRLAEQELAQAEERFQAGVAGSVETTNAQSSVIAARDALIQARVNFGTARVERLSRARRDRSTAVTRASGESKSVMATDIAIDLPAARTSGAHRPESDPHRDRGSWSSRSPSGACGAGIFSRHHVSTDNAQVDGHITAICPEVSGFVAASWWTRTST